MSSLDSFLSPLAFRHPDVLPLSGWVEHIPFALWLMEHARPRVFVELGTHRGASYLAFCQAAESCGLDTRCFAVDTWQGDEHAGHYGEDIYTELARYHDARYGTFSRLVRSTFDEALAHFADGSIDLLHIDGLHTYEAVKHDFESWRPKLSDRAVVLFHDTNVHEQDFGVHKLWAELAAAYPRHFEFLHGHGLGVLGVGDNLPPAVAAFFAEAARPDAAGLIRQSYARLGKPFTEQLTLSGRTADWKQACSRADLLAEELERVNAYRGELEDERARLREQLGTSQGLIEAAQSRMRELEVAEAERQRLAGELAFKAAQLAAVLASRSWRLTAPVRAASTVARRWRRLLNAMLGAFSHPARLKAELRLIVHMRAIRQAGLFDDAWYASAYPDVVQAGWNLLRHYVEVGAFEGRDPNPHFSSSWYLNQYPDVRAARVNPLLHYLRTGAFEKRNPNPDFDTAWYVEHNPEVKTQGVNPLSHYLQVGKAAGRPTNGASQAPFADIEELDEPLGEDNRARLGKAVEVAAAMQTAGPADWSDYAKLKDHAIQLERNRRAKVAAPAPELIDFAGKDLDACAAELAFPAVETPLVSIIVPVFNEAQVTLECLAALRRNTEEDIAYEVIVADDASAPETSRLLARIANIVHRRNAANLNFLRNCNQASRAARGRYLVFLNNDTQVGPGWLRPLLAAFEADPEVGAAGPKILFPNGRLQEAGVKLNRDVSAGLIGCGDDPALPGYNYAREVDYCSGACLMVPTQRFRAVGEFSDELAPAYYEDADLCLKLRQAGYKIMYVPGSQVVHHLSKTTGNGDGSLKNRCIVRNRQKMAEKWQAEIDGLQDVRMLAFYLPQYHAIPENDRWWGKGFTEWRNVAKARPNFVGHYQPRFPADLGYYDLRLPSVMDAQAALARRYGISGFCYYYYWFAGKRLLELPIERMLATGKPDLPFCLCWANENWTRRWDGRDQEVLMAQSHTEDDDLAVIRDLMRYFKAPHYIRVHGKPLLLVYNVKGFPDFRRTAELWRKACRAELGVEPYLAMVESFFLGEDAAAPALYGCDASVEFPPHGLVRPRRPKARLINPNSTFLADDYREAMLRYVTRPTPGHTRFRGVMPSWDNTARRQDAGMCMENASPGGFQAWLELILEQTRQQNFGDERIVFINAWNEWAEGAYLEPDRRYGHAYLEAVRNSLESWQQVSAQAAE